MLFVDNIILWVVVGYGGLGCCSHVVDGIGASGCKKVQEALSFISKVGCCIVCNGVYRHVYAT